MFGPPLHKSFWVNDSIHHYAFWGVRGDVEVGLKVSFLLIVALTSIIANGIIAYVIIRNKNLHKSVYICICNLCVADLLLCLIYPWIFITDHLRQFYIMGDFICHFDSFFIVMCMLVSCISIIYISCEQLYAVVRPFSFKQIQTKTTIISAAVMWIIAISLSLPLFFLRVYTDYHYNDGTIAGCSFSQKMKKIKYLLIITVLMVYVPCVVATIAYTIIICKLEKYNRLLMNKVHTLKIKFRNKVIRMFFIVLLVHLLCWLPLQILILYAAYRPDQGSQLPQWYLVYFTYFAHYLVFLHCAINPFIYGIRNENIKKALLKSFPFLAKKFKRNRVIPTTIVININNGTGKGE